MCHIFMMLACRYVKQLKSNTADLLNCSRERGGGACTAAMFLKVCTRTHAHSHTPALAHALAHTHTRTHALAHSHMWYILRAIVKITTDDDMVANHHICVRTFARYQTWIMLCALCTQDAFTYMMSKPSGAWVNYTHTRVLSCSTSSARSKLGCTWTSRAWWTRATSPTSARRAWPVRTSH